MIIFHSGQVWLGHLVLGPHRFPFGFLARPGRVPGDSPLFLGRIILPAIQGQDGLYFAVGRRLAALLELLEGKDALPPTLAYPTQFRLRIGLSSRLPRLAAFPSP